MAKNGIFMGGKQSNLERAYIMGFFLFIYSCWASPIYLNGDWRMALFLGVFGFFLTQLGRAAVEKIDSIYNRPLC